MNTGSEDAVRMNKYGPRVQETLEKFKENIKMHKLNNIQKLILECFQQLLKKDNFICNISINKESYELNLYVSSSLLLDKITFHMIHICFLFGHYELN